MYLFYYFMNDLMNVQYILYWISVQFVRYMSELVQVLKDKNSKQLFYLKMLNAKCYRNAKRFYLKFKNGFVFICFLFDVFKKLKQGFNTSTSNFLDNNDCFKYLYWKLIFKRTIKSEQLRKLWRLVQRLTVLIKTSVPADLNNIYDLFVKFLFVKCYQHY